MGHTACTEPQCLYKGAFYLYLYLYLYLYSPCGPYGLYNSALYLYIYVNMDLVTFWVKGLQKLRRFCDKAEGSS